MSGLFQKFGRFLFISLFPCPHIEMNFWKPGEAYPDGMEEEKVELDKEAPVDRMAREITKSKVELSDRMKNMSVRGWESDRVLSSWCIRRRRRSSERRRSQQ